MAADLAQPVGQVDVLDLAGRIIADPRRARISTAGGLALALAFESAWAVAIEADLLVRALAMPITGDDAADAARDHAIQVQCDQVSNLMAAIRGETPKGDENGIG